MKKYLISLLLIGCHNQARIIVPATEEGMSCERECMMLGQMCSNNSPAPVDSNAKIECETNYFNGNITCSKKSNWGDSISNGIASMQHSNQCGETYNSCRLTCPGAYVEEEKKQEGNKFYKVVYK